MEGYEVRQLLTRISDKLKQLDASIGAELDSRDPRTESLEAWKTLGKRYGVLEARAAITDIFCDELDRIEREANQC